MRFNKILLCLCLMALAAYSQHSSTGAWPVVRIGIEGDDPPMSFFDGHSQKLTGFDIELAQAACRRAGLKPSFYHSYRNRLFRDLQEKKVDLVWSGIGINTERKSLYAFSRPYMKSQLLLLLRKDSPLRRLRDLEGKAIGYLAGSANEIQLLQDSVLGPSIAQGRTRLKATDPSFLESLAQMEFYGIDALAIDDYHLHALLPIAVERIPVRILEAPLPYRSLGFAARQADSTLVQKLDKAIESLETDGSLQKMRQQWLPPSLPKRLLFSPMRP